MEPSELLRYVVGVLEHLEIEYLITGSMASMAYGEPRFTNDIDIAIQISPAQVTGLCAAFPENDFYLNADAAREEVRQRGQFNVIHSTSGLKIDFMVASEDAFNASRFARRRLLSIAPNQSALFAAPEDVIVRKLQYYREGGSEKHLRDIRGIIKLTGDAIDQAYLDAWIDRLDLRDEWDRVLRDLS